MRDRSRQCVDCGDDIPYYSRICPFCHYDVQIELYDSQSSPYLMMCDLKSLYVELSRIQPIGGALKSLFRLFTLRCVDPKRRQVLEIETTFDVIHEKILINFGRDKMVVDSLVVFEEMLQELLEQRASDIAHMRVIRQRTMFFICSVAIFSALVSVLLYLSPVK